MLNIDEISQDIDLFLEDCTSLIVLGIGNDIRGDDGLGPYIINQLTDLKESNGDLENIHLINGGSVPENFTGLIKKIGPSHMIIVDATLMNEEAGFIKLVNKEDISNVSISTHSMSLTYLIKYLEQDIDFELIFIGIQPENMDLTFELSDKIKDSSDMIVDLLFSKVLDI
ncbi:MAG: hydrogenase maturation peptidase HycI [Methanobrevibacter sp.]|nr:hydrogenase maturation peptidase HycI [Methanobrevibacter sp.]